MVPIKHFTQFVQMATNVIYKRNEMQENSKRKYLGHNNEIDNKMFGKNFF